MRKISNAIVLAITTVALVTSSFPVAAIAEGLEASQSAPAAAVASGGETSDATSTGDGAEQGSQSGSSQQATSESGNSSSTSDSNVDASSNGTDIVTGNDGANSNGSDTGENGENTAYDNASTTASDASAAANAIALASEAPASDTSYAHSTSASQNGVTFTVEWNDSTTAGEATTFHVTQTGGSSNAKVRMDAPIYWDNGSGEVIADTSRRGWMGYAYTLIGDGCDYSLEFTASGSYNVYFYFMDTDNGVGYLRTTEVWVTVDDSSRPAVSSIVSDAVAQARVNTDGSDYSMALYLHDWLLEQLEYDNSYVWSSAESALTRGTGTCQAYTDAYTKLLNAAGIADSQIRDTADNHTWNAVKLDGEWYQVDCTWDDNEDTKIYGFDARHLYFAITDELMAVAHKGHTAIYTASGYATRSTSLEDNYYVRSGLAAEWADAYATRIQAQLDAKATSFSISSDNAINPPSIIGIQNAVVTYAMGQKEWKTTDGTKVELTASSNVTTTSSTSWTAKYEFEVAYLTGHYDVSVYKPSSDSASWAHPKRDGYAFAGWYADESCGTAYTATTGYAYARFVPVSELVRFRGTSLRNDYSSSEKTCLRLSYEFSAPAGATRSGMAWSWTNTKNGKTGRTASKSYWLVDGGSLVANLVFTNLQRSSTGSSYDAPFLVAGAVSYVTADGTSVEATGEQVSRTVAEVARAVASGSSASAEERAYASDIILS